MMEWRTGTDDGIATSQALFFSLVVWDCSDEGSVVREIIGGGLQLWVTSGCGILCAQGDWNRECFFDFGSG